MAKKIISKGYSQLVTKLEVPESYHFIKLTLPDGSISILKSTIGKAWENLILDVDYKLHPAWQSKLVQTITNKNTKEFNSKYSGMGMDL